MYESEFLIIPFIIFLGLIFGSFATAVAYRVPRGEGFVTGRSRCPSCKHALGVLDLFPIFSWLFLRGKCRYCKTGFGSSYPMIEIALSIMFLAIYFQVGISIEAIILALIAITIVILIAIDFEHYIIPDGTNLTLFILGIAYQFNLGTSWQHYILGPLAGLLLGLFLRWIIQVWKKREGLGMGDVKFLIAAGMLLKPSDIDSFLFLSGIIGITTAIIWKIQGKGERFPFGPSLSIALFVNLVFPEFGIIWRATIENLISTVLL